MSNNASPHECRNPPTPSLHSPAGLSDPFAFIPASCTSASSTSSSASEFVLSQVPYSPMPSDPAEIDKWYDRHGLPENQEEYYRNCGVLFTTPPPSPCPVRSSQKFQRSLSTRKRRRHSPAPSFREDSVTESHPAKRRRQSKQLSDLEVIMALLRENLEETRGVRRDVAVLSTNRVGAS